VPQSHRLEPFPIPARVSFPDWPPRSIVAEESDIIARNNMLSADGNVFDPSKRFYAVVALNALLYPRIREFYKNDCPKRHKYAKLNFAIF